jgi:hypothetical protein
VNRTALPQEWDQTLHNMLGELAAMTVRLRQVEVTLEHAVVVVQTLDAKGNLSAAAARELRSALEVVERAPFPVTSADLLRLEPSADGRAVLAICELDQRFLGNVKWLADAIALWTKHQ